jgi:hypothetical protein
LVSREPAASATYEGFVMADTPQPPFSNPPPEGHDDGKHVAKLWMALSGASAHDYHDEMPGVDAKSTKVGHEPDKFNPKTIIYVPIAVAITLVVTYLLVQGAFLFVNGRESRQEAEVKTDSTDPEVIAKIRKENETKVKPWNERSVRTRTWTPESAGKSTPNDQPLSPAPQPQLEANRQFNFDRLDASGRTVTDPPFLRSFADKGENNAPILYPEDLRPQNYTDPWHGDAKLLAETAWVKGHEGKLATVNIDEMIHLVAHDDKWKGTLKVAEKKATLTPGTLGKPKMSAGGLVGPVPVAGEKKDDGHGHGK